MANVFLKVNKDLFKLGLNPTEILVLAQVIEFNTNTGDCFMSDKAMAEAFGVSEKTISRTMKALEDRGFIKRDTRVTQKGKERHITAAMDKLTVAKETPTDKMTVAERTNCPLRNGQNDLIKDNSNKIREKDNNSFLLPNGNKKGAVAQGQRSILPVEEKPFNELTHKEMVERFNRELGF